MDDKYQQLIEVLAAKLGTTAEHLWGVLVRQAPISGAVDLVWCIAIAAAAWWWVALTKRKTTRPQKTEDDRYPRAEWEDERMAMAWVGSLMAVAFALICIIASAQGIVAAFANPEYWALKQLMLLR